jgi:HAD superfamily hydrolase (TIGR01509 family)
MLMGATVCPPLKPAIKAVILDAGGVILHPNFDWIEAQAAQKRLRLSRQALYSAYYRTIYHIDLDPQLFQEGAALTNLQVRHRFFRHLLHFAGLKREEADAIAEKFARQAEKQFPRESDIYHWAMPGIRGKLERLRHAGCRLGCASNNDGALEAQLQSVAVCDLFDTLKDSGREGVAKPGPELLLRAAGDLGLPPSHCLFIGDVDRIDGQAARAAAMPFALLDPLNQPRTTSPLFIGDLMDIFEHFTLPGSGLPSDGAGER